MATRIQRVERQRQRRIAPNFPAAALSTVGLTLVVIFVVLGVLNRRSNMVVLPSSSQVAPATWHAYRVLTFDVEGLFMLDGERLSREALERSLTKLGELDPQPVLRVRAAAALPFSEVQRLIASIHARGVKNVQLEAAAAPVADSSAR